MIAPTARSRIAPMPPVGGLDADEIDLVLCDADGTLFDSEDAAFAISTIVTNRLLAELGIDGSYTPARLRRWAAGRNFRATASALADEAGVLIDPDALEQWVTVERREVTDELAVALRPVAAVRDALESLSRRFRLSIVTSSATSRLDACLIATGLDGLFPVDVRFSAEDSLPTPLAKPDPAIYRCAGQRLGVVAARGLAVEDSVAGVRSAVAAGFPTVGMLQFVPRDERADRAAELREAGAGAIVGSWGALAGAFATDEPRARSWNEDPDVNEASPAL